MKKWISRLTNVGLMLRKACSKILVFGAFLLVRAEWDVEGKKLKQLRIGFVVGK